MNVLDVIQEIDIIYAEVNNFMYYSDRFDWMDVCVGFRSEASMYYSDRFCVRGRM